MDIDYINNDMFNDFDIYKEISNNSKNPNKKSNFAFKINLSYESCILDLKNNNNVPIISSEKNIGGSMFDEKVSKS